MQEEQSADPEVGHVLEWTDALILDGYSAFGQDVSARGINPAALRFR
jgi:hypothetical protein